MSLSSLSFISVHFPNIHLKYFFALLNVSMPLWKDQRNQRIFVKSTLVVLSENFLAEENAILVDRKITDVERWINFQRDDYTLLVFFLKAKILLGALCFTQYWNKIRNFFVNDMLIIYFIQEENQKKDKQKRPISVMRQQNRRFRDIKNTYFFLRKLTFLQEQLCSR